MKKAIVTGSSGFIGYHVCKRLIIDGYTIIGVDDMNDYYDVNLKIARQKELLALKNFTVINSKIETPGLMLRLFEEHKPNILIHLAAQAGVRYSIENPRAYLDSNIIGTFEILEAARNFPPEHLLIASTSSAYGSNKEMPYKENVKADHQMSFYAATKKSSENIAHSYSHLFNLPTTVFRFFTVYGPWGRPDMALFKFTKAIMENKPIEVFNNGNMKRDFTYVEDLVNALSLLIKKAPNNMTDINKYKNDSLSPVAPYRVINIGNSRPEELGDFIAEIENATNKTAKKIYSAMQAGDVPSTWADSALLTEITSYKPKTNISQGVKNFVDWYREFYENN
jgi:UDP-glucuronate 4-epimerase